MPKYSMLTPKKVRDSSVSPKKVNACPSILMQVFYGCAFDNFLSEASKDWPILERITEVASTGVRQGFVEVVAQIPSHAQPISDQAQKPPFRTNVFKQHDQLELKEHFGINGRTTTMSIGLFDQVTDT